MNMRIQPPFGTPAFKDWDTNYNPSKSARVAPNSINSYDEAIAALVRLSKRMRYYQDILDECATVNRTNLVDEEELRSFVFKENTSKSGLLYTKKQAISVVYHNYWRLHGKPGYQTPKGLDPILTIM